MFHPSLRRLEIRSTTPGSSGKYTILCLFCANPKSQGHELNLLCLSQRRVLLSSTPHLYKYVLGNHLTWLHVCAIFKNNADLWKSRGNHYVNYFSTRQLSILWLVRVCNSKSLLSHSSVMLPHYVSFVTLTCSVPALYYFNKAQRIKLWIKQTLGWKVL